MSKDEDFAAVLNSPDRADCFSVGRADMVSTLAEMITPDSPVIVTMRQPLMGGPVRIDIVMLDSSNDDLMQVVSMPAQWAQAIAIALMTKSNELVGMMAEAPDRGKLN